VERCRLISRSILPTLPPDRPSTAHIISLKGMRSSVIWFYLVCSVVILVGLAIHLSDASRVGFVVSDDAGGDLMACAVRTGGIREYVRLASRNARGQGRIGFFVAWAPFIAPYFVDQPRRAEIITLVHFLSFAAFAAFAGLYLGPPVATLILVALVCLVPDPGGHYPVMAYPLLFQTSVGLFFLAACFHELSRSKLRQGFFLWAFRLLIAVCVLLSLCESEAFDLVFAIFASGVFAYQVHVNRRNASARPVLGALRSEAPIIVPFQVYAVAYVLFRVAHPSEYNGNTLSRNSLNVVAAAKAAVIYCFAGLPGANWTLGGSSIRRVEGLAPGQTLWAFLIEHAGWPECVLAAGAALVLGSYVLCADVVHEVRFVRARDRLLPVKWGAAGGMRAGLVGAAILMAIGVVGQLPIAVIDKYQQNPIGWSPYVTSYLGFLCFCAAIGLLLPAFAVRLRRGRTIAAGVLAVLGALFAGVAREASSVILSRQEDNYATWRLVDGFLKTPRFASLPDGAAILAPNLWERNSPQPDNYPDYWQNYINGHSGRSLRVARTREEIAAAGPGPEYYLEVQQTGDFGAPVLLMSDLTLSADGDATGRHLFVLSMRRLRDAAVTFLRPLPPQATGSTEESGAGSLEVAQMPPFSYTAGVFVSGLDVPDGFVTGSAVIQSSLALSPNKMAALGSSPYVPFVSRGVSVEFGPGFSGLETSPDHYWHWSNGPSGEGVINLWNRTRHPVSVTFSACIHTGYAEPSKLVLRFHDTTETLTANAQCGNIHREFTLQTGKNELYLKSYAPRLRAPGDSRYIVFGVDDWTISVLKRWPRQSNINSTVRARQHQLRQFQGCRATGSA
jgi:hypothetical protein